MEWLLLILPLPYLVIMAWVFKGLKKQFSLTVKEHSRPFISVVVAARNEENNIPGLIDALASQDYHAENYEVLIIDDNSTDSTLLLAEGLFDKCRGRAVQSNGSGKKAALRTGIREASSDLILVTDADCRPGKSWISSITQWYSMLEPDMMICPVEIEPAKGILRRFEQIEFLALQGVTAGSALIGNPLMCNGANLFFKKESYLQCEGDLKPGIPTGDDIFLLHCLKRMKDKKICWIAPGPSTMLTSGSTGISSFLKQRARWISKAGSYKDTETTVTAIVTFVTILAILTCTVLWVAGVLPFLIPAGLLALKSIPDYLIIRKVTGMYGRVELMRYFIPAQLLYPFYVAAVTVFYSVQRISSPFRKGI